MLVGTADAGILRSTSDPARWLVSNRGINDHRVHLLAATSSDLFAATWTGDLFRTSDGGDHWERMTSFGPGVISAMAGTPDGSIHLALRRVPESVRMVRSSDGGRTWIEATSHPVSDQYLTINDIAVDRNGELFAGSTVGLFQSIDNGATWSRAQNDPTEYITRMAIAGDYLVLLERTGMIHRTRIGSNNWEQFRVDPPEDFFVFENDIALLPDGRILVATARGVWRTDSAGTGWEQSGLGENGLFTIVATPDGRVMAAASQGITFISGDGGSSWQRIGGELGSQLVLAFAVDSAGAVYAGTQVDGVLRAEAVASLDDKRNEKEVIASAIHRIAPNPATGVVDIELDVREAGHVRLSCAALPDRCCGKGGRSDAGRRT
jgi:photosystem II stability/assembly factor-like uncharacterized protein